MFDKDVKVVTNRTDCFLIVKLPKETALRAANLLANGDQDGVVSQVINVIDMAYVTKEIARVG